MKGSRTYIQATAYHEAGHAVAALNVGRSVHMVIVDLQRPGNGRMGYKTPSKNPFNIGDGAGNAKAAWNYTYQMTLDSIFVLLAGPMAESKLLRKPLRLMGNKSDLNRSILLKARLERLSEFASDYTDVPKIDVDLLERMRGKVRRWVGRPRTWKAVETVADRLTERGEIDSDELSYLVGESKGYEFGQLHLENTAPYCSLEPIPGGDNLRFITPSSTNSTLLGLVKVAS
jgi:hypothetical protein